jgi:hypothetical protein
VARGVVVVVKDMASGEEVREKERGSAGTWKDRPVEELV